MTNQTQESRHRGLWLLPLATLLMLAACATTSGAEQGGADTGSDAPPLMSIEVPRSIDVELPFTISGWALDEAAEDPGISKVQVLDHGCEGDVIGVAEYGTSRRDIGSKYGSQFEDSGWQFEVARLHPGERTLAVRVFADGSTTYDACETLPVVVGEAAN